MKYPAWLCVCLGMLTASAHADESWYVVLNGEDRVGYMHTSETADPEAQTITTSQTFKIAMGRAGATIDVQVESTFTETAEGLPVEASSTLGMGGVPMVTQAKFSDDRITVTAGQGGRTSTKTQPAISGDWMPPAAMRRFVEQKLADGAEQIQVRTLDIAMGLTPIEMNMKVIGEQDVEVYGKVVPAIVWDATASVMPNLKMREYVDAQGNSIKSTMSLMPGMEFTILQADKALALSELTPAEMMAQTFVVPSRPIDRPRELQQAVYRLKSKNGQPVNVPTLASQTAKPLDGGAVELAVGEYVGEREIDRERYLQASAVLNHEDPVIAKAYVAAALAMSEHPTPRNVADRLRGFVATQIKTKDLSVGFATASDVARTKQGDCTEHAVYLAALLRAGGIPSRCVSGLVYADQFAGHEGIFGYHMWTQAWIDDDGDGPAQGAWVDYDATLPSGVRFDATHIALSVSDMNDGLVSNDLAALLPLLGNLEIEVVQTGYDE